jgi:hypothetical protein
MMIDSTTPIDRWYFDTSAQIERHGGTRETRQRLKELVRGARVATSTQVLREWNRIVFDSCVAVRNALGNAQEWRDVVPQLRRDFGRKPSHHWMVSEWIHQGDTRDLRLVSMRAKDFQRIRGRVMFNAGLDEIRDGTNCPISRRKPIPTSKGWRYKSTCKKTESICDQPDFLRQELNRAKAASTALAESTRPEDARMGREALRALNELESGGTKGKACHGNRGLGGDIGIALECAPDETLIATDASFDLICPAIGLKNLHV